jgi:hypothetical protein
VAEVQGDNFGVHGCHEGWNAAGVPPRQGPGHVVGRSDQHCLQGLKLARVLTRAHGDNGLLLGQVTLVSTDIGWV